MIHSKLPPSRSLVVPSKKYKSTRILGFTLIELIVVITILAILGTIGFLSIGGYSSRARDSARVGDTINIAKSLDVSVITKGVYPTPDSAFFVTYSGGTVWTQGTIGATVMQNLRTSIAWGGLNKKPVDPLDNSEYVYSSLAYGSAYQIKAEYEGDISQTASNFQDIHVIGEASAAAGNPTIAYIRGNYGGLMAKTLTGETTYILAVPSIISSTGTLSNFLRIEQNALSGALLFQGKNLVNASSFNPNLAPIFSGTGGVPSTSTDITNMMLALQNRYTWATNDIKSLTNIANIIAMNTGSLSTLGVNLVKSELWGSARVSTGNNENNNTSFTAFSGLGTNVSPWTKSDGSVLKNCQEYNLQATVMNNGTARSTGTCGNGSQACLTSGVYRIDPDGTTATVSPVNIYCDMTTDGGGWTLISKFSWSSDGVNSYGADTAFNTNTLTDTNATSNAKLSTDAIYAMSTWPSSVFRVKSTSFDTLIKSNGVKNSFDPIRLNDPFSCKQVSAGSWTNYAIQAVGVCTLWVDNWMTNRVTTWTQGCSYVGYSGVPAGNPCGNGSILFAASNNQWNDAGYTGAGANPGIWYLR